MTQFTCKGVKQINNRYHLNTFTTRISQRFSSAWEFQMGNFQKYWSQNVGQDFIVLDFFHGQKILKVDRRDGKALKVGRNFFCWGEIAREINVSHAGDPVHAGDKALTWETPAQRGRVNRYGLLCLNWHLFMGDNFTRPCLIWVVSHWKNCIERIKYSSFMPTLAVQSG